MKKEKVKFEWVDVDTVVYHFKKLLNEMKDGRFIEKGYGHKFLNYIFEMVPELEHVIKTYNDKKFSVLIVDNKGNYYKKIELKGDGLKLRVSLAECVGEHNSSMLTNDMEPTIYHTREIKASLISKHPFVYRIEEDL